MGSMMAAALTDSILALFTAFAYSSLPEIRPEFRYPDLQVWDAECNALRLGVARRTWMGNRANRLGWVEAESRVDARAESGCLWSRIGGRRDE